MGRKVWTGGRLLHHAALASFDTCVRRASLENCPSAPGCYGRGIKDHDRATAYSSLSPLHLKEVVPAGYQSLGAWKKHLLRSLSPTPHLVVFVTCHSESS